jgi:tRNA G18 (ribose-2'-O)-methylase SpoU
MGAAFLLPIARATSWPDELAVLARLGFRLVALTPDPGAGAIDDLAGDDVADDRLADDPSGDGRGVGTSTAGRVAVMLGAEGPGLSPAALAAADVAVRIPMHGDVDSLNVGHAAAIAFHHFAGRARRWASLSSGR